MLWQVIHIAEWLLWGILAVSVGYVVFFALASKTGRRKETPTGKAASSVLHDFLVVYPAYHEDAVIRHSVETFLQQDYPSEHYRLVVVSDHMEEPTNRWLAMQPLTLIRPDYQKSSKAKAMQAALSECGDWKADSLHRKVVVLDADNIVSPDFLTRLNRLCQQTDSVIQCHRTAKNADNDIAALDGISEEINNTLFRKGHNRIGLSSALIGSGMCFDFDWFRQHVSRLSTAVEDRELEAMLMREGIHIHYAEDLYVLDEKVSSSDNFQRQRLRWMTGQVQALLGMLSYLPRAIATGNINYVDKTLQQALLPRSILIALLPMLSLVVTLLYWRWGLKWWALTLCFAVALFMAIPPQLRTRALFGRLSALASMVWRMLTNLLRMDRKNTDFVHTQHSSSPSPTNSTPETRP